MTFARTRARAVFAALAAVTLLAGPAAARRPPGPRDPLIPMIQRMDRYFESHEMDGVTLDARYPILPTEVMRQSVISELLGYAELARLDPRPRYRSAVVSHADYLVAHFDEALSGGPFDGMLGDAMLGAFEVTGDSAYLDRGRIVIERLRALPPYQLVLNGGLMAALAFARHQLVTGDLDSGRRAHDIIGSVVGYQNADGSFPHWCGGSEDVSYTGWMSMELVLLQRMLGDARIDPMLQGTYRFMSRRIDGDGRTSYQEPCPDSPGCTRYYYSLASGCPIDYDTRAFTNEPGYSALIFDHAHATTRTRAVLRFLGSLENRGTFPDKWDFWPPPSDPYYVWTASDTSVVNMGVIFWSLAVLLSGRQDEERNGPEADLDDAGSAALTGEVALASAGPRGPGWALRIRVPAAARGSLAIFDAAGRRVRELDPGGPTDGERLVVWDGCDRAGRACASGLYFARLAVAGTARVARIPIRR
jgi:hypothetical protein